MSCFQWDHNLHINHTMVGLRRQKEHKRLYLTHVTQHARNSCRSVFNPCVDWLICLFFQNGASSFNAFSTTQSVINIKTGGKTMYSVDASGNLFVASSVTTDQSALRYACGGNRCVLSDTTVI